MRSIQTKFLCILILPFLFACEQTIRRADQKTEEPVTISSEKDRFVTEEEFNNNLQNQLKMSPQTLVQLRQYGITENKELSLEYFFYTNSAGKAKQLADQLSKLNYSVEHKLAADSQTEYVITGWTTKMKMAGDVVSKWTREMCVLGYKFDCDFDGWGTKPE